MTMDTSTGSAQADIQEGGDPAEAFDRLRAVIEGQDRELALLRRAVEGLAAERAHIDVPDYSETLGRMQQGVDATADRIAVINDVIARSPALAMTPEQITQRIAAAGSAARREDQAALTTARKGMDDATRELHGYVVSARRGDEQNRWLAFAAISGVVLGIMLWAVFGGALARATPDSWRWPESMAARTLGGTAWEGARRLATANGSDTWNAMVAGAVIGQGNEAALERCQRAANKAGEPARCTIRIKPDGRGTGE
ncbi:3-deoxy-D-manno-octulosonate 8-phosphate phosphatase KdsC-like HAD superfamily phosphatase [Sphingomonas yabuuchiae]|uniref:3-deoxy-D-manno-octulosonate 8-phosphate phosphatase KdsC-like HAD superfamily phosphatase n=2 Tax=Sphingomonas yabuuchiae TaxID=172044 RepID=A0ABR6KE88_9SPHN|nr:3-deoxy-D-manno-octulosonate 8-phosphate phosphatase KdsC-like HAD superfamily phosphatase [Sphingomonas yabuuchiae]